MANYDYEGYFSKQEKINYWKAKEIFDKKYLLPIVDSKKYTLNAGAGLFIEKDVLKLKKVVCVDISATAVKTLKQQGINAVQANLLEKWPFKSEEFEQILMLDIFEHIAWVKFYLSEAYRVAKKGAVIILGIPLLNYWKTYLKLLSMTTIGVQYEEHPRMFFDKDIKTLFQEAGFKLAETKYIGISKGYGYYKFIKN